MPHNTMNALIRYFASDEQRIFLLEFRLFWESLDYEEKRYFFLVDLETGLLPD